MISTPLSSIATIFLIVTNPERNKKILLTKLVQANVAGDSKRKKELNIIRFGFVVVVIVLAYNTKRIYIDKSTTFSKTQLFMT